MKNSEEFARDVFRRAEVEAKAIKKRRRTAITVCVPVILCFAAVLTTVSLRTDVFRTVTDTPEAPAAISHLSRERSAVQAVQEKDKDKSFEAGFLFQTSEIEKATLDGNSVNPQDVQNLCSALADYDWQIGPSDPCDPSDSILQISLTDGTDFSVTLTLDGYARICREDSFSSYLRLEEATLELFSQLNKENT